ncbi:MAG TPA: hypothetical protein VNN77_04390 [candidate division Zixibacteria bacterium]|nr:hypothetical protein [candidate division Zixibacteria bacterium]
MIRSDGNRPMLISLTVLALHALPLWAAEGLISKVPDPSGTYCHLKFPAIREETLGWARPVLKDPSEGDIIDFYGPCDHDPIGKEQVQWQKDYLRRERNREASD